MKIFAFLALGLILTACGDKANVRYQTIDKVVEVPKPLPGWATIPLVLPPLKDGRVESHLRREHLLENILDLANCHRALIEKLARGEYADPEVCAGATIPESTSP